MTSGLIQRDRDLRARTMLTPIQYTTPTTEQDNYPDPLGSAPAKPLSTVAPSHDG